MTYVGLATVLVMIAFGGLGVDYMQSELKRTKMQAVLDRSVLAAADMDNTLNPRDVINDYFNKSGISGQLNNTADFGLSGPNGFGRIASANANLELNSNFSNLLGIDYFDVSAAATAEEFNSNLEISLALDVSGSMALNNRLANMQAAAQLFVNTVTDNGRSDHISISLVPYSEHVNIGAIADMLNIDRVHTFSNCIELDDPAFFGTTNLSTSLTYDQVQHFQWNYFGFNDVSRTVCPWREFMAIQPVTNDTQILNEQIRQFQPQAGTSIFLGMKWAAALLDPSLRGTVNELRRRGLVPGRFINLPRDFGSRGVEKHIVLMSDGRNENSFRLDNNFYQTGDQIRFWAVNNLWSYLQSGVISSENWENFYTQLYDGPQGDALLQDICGAAKRSGIVVWTIAFESDAVSQGQLRQCASSSAHHFNASGADLQNVFYSIATSLRQLRLVR